MFFDSTKVHRLFRIGITKSNNFSRKISYFRTNQGILIHLFVYPKKDNPWIAISVTRANPDFNVDENFQLNPDGSCELHVNTSIRSTTGWAIHSLRTNTKYQPSEALESEWLRKQLDVLADWLTDKKTVRVDPYNPNRVLDNGEDEVDRFLATTVSALDEFNEKLRDTSLTPGIHII